MRITKHANGVYYASYRSASGPVELSLKTRDKAEAVALARDAKLENIEHLAKANALTQEAITRAVVGRRVTGEAAVTHWESWCVAVGLQPNTVELYRVQINALLRDTGLLKKPVASLDFALLNGWVNAAGTLAARMGRIRAAKSFCAVLAGKGLIAGQPAEALRIRYHDLGHAQKERVSHEPFTPDEVSVLLKELPPVWAAMSSLSLDTGFRLSDCASIERDCFLDDKRTEVAIWMGKVDRRIALPLPARTRKLLAHAEEPGSRYLFPHFAEVAADPKRRSILSTYFSREAKKVGVEGKPFHSFRHTFATEQRKLGATLDEIRLKLGHELADTTRTYVHVE